MRTRLTVYRPIADGRELMNCLNRPNRTKHGVAAVLFLALIPMGCGDGSSHFEFRHTGSLGEVRSFVASTTDPEIIATAREELALPRRERSLFIYGPVAKGDGGVNQGWGWHFVPSRWELVHESLEICDADPDFLEVTIQDWLKKIGRYCPWSARLAEER